MRTILIVLVITGVIAFTSGFASRLIYNNIKSNNEPEPKEVIIINNPVQEEKINVLLISKVIVTNDTFAKCTEIYQNYKKIYYSKFLADKDIYLPYERDQLKATLSKLHVTENYYSSTWKYNIKFGSQKDLDSMISYINKIIEKESNNYYIGEE